MRLRFWSPEVLTSHQAAARCGVSVQTLCHWIKAGLLAAQQRDGKYFVNLAEVQALLRLRRLVKRPRRVPRSASSHSRPLLV
jgi:predicted site-specific integrase-resolvase